MSDRLICAFLKSTQLTTGKLLIFRHKYFEKSTENAKIMACSLNSNYVF